MVTKEMVPRVGTVQRKKGAHTDMKHEWDMREVTLLFVVEFWHILGDLISKVGFIFLRLHVSIYFL